MRKLSHVGIPTSIKQPEEIYSPEMKLFLTDFNKSPNRIEFLRFEEDSEMPELLKTHAHLAYEVDDMEAELRGKKILIPPSTDEDGFTMAFVIEEGIAVELMHFAK